VTPERNTRFIIARDLVMARERLVDAMRDLEAVRADLRRAEERHAVALASVNDLEVRLRELDEPKP
jgi:hypothetical protein